jgi:hypothetical protein
LKREQARLGSLGASRSPWAAFPKLVIGCVTPEHFIPPLARLDPGDSVSPVVFIPDRQRVVPCFASSWNALAPFRLWRAPVVVEMRCKVRRVPFRHYRAIVDYAPDNLPMFEDWLVRGNARAPGLWNTHEGIPAHVRFRPKEHIRAIRTRSVTWESWTDAGGKHWKIGRGRKEASAYSAYLGPRIRPFPHEDDSAEWTQQVAVRSAEDVGGRFMAHRTPLIAQNRLWRAVVGRLFIDAVESRPLAKRTATKNDQARPTYVGRENARDLLLYDNPPLADRDALSALSGIEEISAKAWEIAPRNWYLPELDKILRRNLNRSLYGFASDPL